VHFTRLRLTGFKSFVDPTDLLIEPGLTAIVGPNGCGKSNLVEALRWVMGETSARQLRGREMDDVIFGGSASRPKRNHAEVSVLLDNAARSAPAMFNDYSEIEVSRRIERGAGSVYRINGKETRARDVALLFADEATGSRSTAMVSQGRIGSLIAAKPAQRRGLLDEAAGITGLHSRRHEAELRLSAAETNLERLDDVTGALETQLQGLKRQARQANRYRRVSERIRETEALLFHRRWRAAEDAVIAADQAFDAAGRAVGEAERAAARAATARTEAAAALPPLREVEQSARAALHRLEVRQVSLDAEERRLNEVRRALDARLVQIDADVERETALARDAEDAMAKLDAETARLAAAREGEAEAEQAALAARDEAGAETAAVEAAVESLAGRLAAAEARRLAIDRQIEDLDARIERLRARAREVEVEQAALAAEDGGEIADGDADEALAAVEARLDAARAALDEAEHVRESAQAAERAAREATQAAETVLAALDAEERALADLLDAEREGRWPAVIDAVSARAGYEAALAAALGEDLSASLAEDAPLRWTGLDFSGDPPALPDGATPLTEVVEAPAPLARRLGQIGVVEAADGARLQGRLAQGQRLVSRDGALWRWDGLVVAAEAETPAARRLRQRNRLAAVRAELAEARARRAAEAEAQDKARTALGEAQTAEARARERLRETERARDVAREERARASARAAARAQRGENLRETAERLAADLAEATAARAAAETARAEIAAEGDDRAELERLRARLAERRGELSAREHALETLRRDAALRRERLDEVAAERESWRQRAEGASQRLAQLAARRESAEADLAAIAERPAAIAAERATLLSELGEAQRAAAEAADAVAEAETRLDALDRALKESDAASAAAREERVRREGEQARAAAMREEVLRAIAERLGCAAADLAGLAHVEDPDAVPPAEEIEARLAKLVREREAIGAVNLRAEAEAAEVGEQLAALAEERADLEAAIARLRQAIGRLDREGRERLLAAFETINGHFGALFTRLFGGGRAHLSLVDSEDPLDAGLEIMASPPGKRLQSLSLLSGGEQALTALALLFAVFLTNPTPICVLDEVDAPLDDANVERFCDLVDEIARGSATRFIVVTHHRMTMARMDRLFGVTMSERGVSRLVSVDLQTAEALRATA